ncbi:MAG: patatin-like phospholipase family protein, partial [Calditrichia bacterium]
DLIAGTSTGGILSCIFLCPEKKSTPPRPRFTASEAVDLYLQRGDRIFDISLWQRIKSAGGLLDEKYSAAELEKALREYLDNLKLSDLLKPCLITAYDIQRRQAKFFTAHDAKTEKGEDFYLRQVARATSAAPTYFETARVKSFTKTVYPLVDGGVFANNPTLCAYAEARHKLPGNPKAVDMAILSIGTSYIKKAYDYNQAKDWGMVEWLKPILDIMMSGVSETVDYQLQQIFDAVGKPEQYLRINGKLKYANSEMDDVSRENLDALVKDGRAIAKNFDKELDAFVEMLVKGN